MTDQHFALFDTPIGICGIEWGPRGINGLQLPMGSDDKTRTRIRQRHGDIIESAPTAEVRRAIDRIVELLAGARMISGTSCSISTACPSSTAASMTLPAASHRARP